MNRSPLLIPGRTRAADLAPAAATDPLVNRCGVSVTIRLLILPPCPRDVEDDGILRDERASRAVVGRMELLLELMRDTAAGTIVAAAAALCVPSSTAAWLLRRVRFGPLSSLLMPPLADLFLSWDRDTSDTVFMVIVCVQLDGCGRWW